MILGFAAIVMRESRSTVGRAIASSKDAHIQNDVHFVAQPLYQTLTSLEDAYIEDVGSDLSSSMSKLNPSWNDGNLRVNEYIFDEIFCEKTRCAQLILIGILSSIACANVCKDVIDIGVLFSARTRSRLKCFKEDILCFIVLMLSRLEIGFWVDAEIIFYYDKHAFVLNIL